MLVAAERAWGLSHGTGLKKERVCWAWALVYKGRAGWCLENLCLLANSASSSCKCPASGNKISQRALVPLVDQMRPLNPFLTKRGKYPLWSMWAWVKMTSLMEEGESGRGFQFLSRSILSP